jgi:hypothetical protein
MREALLQSKNDRGGANYVPGTGEITGLLRCLLALPPEEEAPVIAEYYGAGLCQTVV